MSKFEAFFKKNKKEVEQFEVKLESFEAPFVLRVISGQEHKQIQKEATKRVKFGRNEKSEMDSQLYNEKLVMASIVSPDLSDQGLQDAYSVHGETELYNIMLNWAEQILLVEQILDKSGFNQTLDDKVDQAKK